MGWAWRCPNSNPLIRVLENRSGQSFSRLRRQRKDQKSSIHDLPDDLLRRILLRLDSPLWLIRAACACRRWRRAVTDGGDEGRAFLRLARSLHPPAVVGHYHSYFGGGYRFVPVPSSSPAIGGSRFSVRDFQDNHSSIADCHGGLVLLRMRYGPFALSVPNLLVYDPLTRKHRWMSRPRPPSKHVYSYNTKDTYFLLDGDDEGISISNFRVLYRLNAAAAGDPQACVFSTAYGGEWDWLFSIDLNTMVLRVLPEEETYCQTSRNSIFNYTLPWPHFLRACPKTFC